jgi:signal transduction histidine kinase
MQRAVLYGGRPAADRELQGFQESVVEAFANGASMPQPAFASINIRPSRPPAAQWAHDIRNALAITSLHLETLERLSGSVGRKAANAAQAAMKRAVGMCNASLANCGGGDQYIRRSGFDLVTIIDEIKAILEPIVPEGFEIRIAPQTNCPVLANPSDVYRIIFNLVHNAIEVARAGGEMNYVSIEIARAGSAVAVRISDDGPGLPKSIQTKMFRRQHGIENGGNGFGIAIARELAERNGSTLRLVDGAKGTNYVLELPGLNIDARSPERVRSVEDVGV